MLALTFLQAAVSSEAAAARAGGLIGDVASLVHRALSPSVAAIPDRREAKSEDGGKGKSTRDKLLDLTGDVAKLTNPLAPLAERAGILH
jgi:hypothetical protein